MRDPRFYPVEETPEEREINDKIEEWHLRYTGDLPLHEFLGWTLEEFDAWVTC